MRKPENGSSARGFDLREARRLRQVSFSTKRFDSMRKHTLTGNIKLTSRVSAPEFSGNRRDVLVYCLPVIAVFR